MAVAVPLGQAILLVIGTGAAILVTDDMARRRCIRRCVEQGGTVLGCLDVCRGAFPEPPPTPTPTPTPPPPPPAPPPPPPPPEIPTSAALTVEQVCIIDDEWERLLLRFPGNPTIQVPVWTNTPTRPNQLTLWGQGAITGCSGFSMEQLLAQAGQRLIPVELQDGCGPGVFGFMFVPAICAVTPTPPPPSPWHSHPGACLHPDEAATRAAINTVFGPLGLADTMIAIARCESGFEPQCWNGGCCYGILQMADVHEAGLVNAGIIVNWDEMADPLTNARAALWLFNQQPPGEGLRPWVCARTLGFI